MPRLLESIMFWLIMNILDLGYQPTSGLVIPSPNLESYRNTIGTDDFLLNSALSGEQRPLQLPGRNQDQLVAASKKKNVTDLAKQRPRGTTESSSGELDSGISKRSVVIIAIDTEPQCLPHHEYAVILQDADPKIHPELRVFINRRNESRFYVCRLCRSCPPGVRIISPCHRRRDTVCSTLCFNPDQVYDPARQVCDFPATSGGQDDLPSTAPTTRTESPLFLPPSEDGKNDDIDEEAIPPRSKTESMATASSLRNHVTAITVAVVSLNLLLISIIILIQRRTRKILLGTSNGEGTVRKLLRFVSRRRDCPEHYQPCAVSSSTAECGLMTSTPPRIPTSMHSPADPCQTSTTPSMLLPHESLFQPRHQQMESELDAVIRREKGEATAEEEEENDRTEDDERPHRPDIRVLAGKDPYSLVMIGEFGPEGGKLSCEDSDIILEIPPGAIPAGRPSQVIIARVSLRPDVVGPALGSPDSIWLTPLVEFESPGLDRFDKDVRMRLPHCALLNPGWSFRVHFTDSTVPIKKRSVTKCDAETLRGSPSNDCEDAEATWFVTAHQRDKSSRGSFSRDSGVSFTVDEKFFNVSTSHFSKYVCSGCHKAHPLQLEAVVYWKRSTIEDHEEITLKTYIVDPIKDFRKLVDANERSSPNHTGFSPLTLSYKKKQKQQPTLQISVQENMGISDWKWRLQTFNGVLPATRVKLVKAIIRCCSSQIPLQETFMFRMKESVEPGTQTNFQTIVTFAQLDNPAATTRILVDTSLKQNNGPIVMEAIAEASGDVVSDDQLEWLADNLPQNKVRPLYRKLIGSGANNSFDQIAAQFPKDSHEQAYEAVAKWRQSQGRHATAEKLARALREVELTTLAENLARVGHHDRNTPSVVPDILCEVTDL